jgi:hypothetical protein
MRHDRVIALVVYKALGGGGQVVEQTATSSASDASPAAAVTAPIPSSGRRSAVDRCHVCRVVAFAGGWGQVS